jgi:hypothetical protein
MSLENECASLELCQEWKKIGGRQDTCFRRSLDVFGMREISDIIKGRGEEVAAPMIGEMMEWKKSDIIVGYSIDFNWWFVHTFREKAFRDSKSLANALMQMCIYIEREKYGKT